MTWQKRGLLIEPPNHLGWSASHAAVPHAQIHDGALKVYFTTRDERSRSHIAVADVDLERRIVDVADAPVLAPGQLGAFDDSGVMTSCLVDDETRSYLYYQGWSLGVTVPFYVFVGCAVSEGEGEPFVRVSQAPILDRDRVDPYMCSSPWVMREGAGWRMWYVSNIGWRTQRGGPATYIVHIKYAESGDGIEWNRDGHVCIDFAAPDEYAISRPCVVKDGDVYRMWYSHRGPAYRIGYAESFDGLSWIRRDEEAGITVSRSGWDSEMLEYACVFDHSGFRHMLYNGNDFGREGVGHAVLGGRA
jgi:hypothetical protein